jgi:hypothetical protein
MLLQGGVQLIDISLMVLVVVQVHRLLVDVRLQGGVIIRQGWDFMWHGTSSCALSKDLLTVITCANAAIILQILFPPHQWRLDECPMEEKYLQRAAGRVVMAHR